LWPVTGTDKPGNVADLWHAALTAAACFQRRRSKITQRAMQENGEQHYQPQLVGCVDRHQLQKLDTSTAIYQASFDSGNGPASWGLCG